MATINLLPEDLRKREERELKRLAKKPKRFTIDLTQANVDRPATSQSDSRPSFWQRLLGTSSRPSVPANSPSTNGQPTSPVDLAAVNQGRSNQINVSEPAGKIGSTSQPAKIVLPVLGRPFGGPVASGDQPPSKPFGSTHDLMGQSSVKVRGPQVRNKNNWWQRLFGPIMGGSAQTASGLSRSVPRQPQTDSASASVRPNPATVVTSRVVRRPAKHWWSGLFGAKAKAQPRPTVAPVKSNLSPAKTEMTSPGAESKKSAPGGYHQPPKAHKTGWDINLIPEELLSTRYFSLTWRLTVLVLAIVLPLTGIFGLYWFLDQEYQKVQETIILEQQESIRLQQAINRLQGGQALDQHYYQRLIKINELWQKHIRWTNFFQNLERYTLDGVHIMAIEADVTGALVLPAVATNYDVAAQQIVALQQAPALAKSVEATNMQLLTDPKKGVIGVKFNIQIMLADQLLQSSSSPTSI